ncbi:hypothetical protein [Lactobacillus acidophilus]|uniref:hypothetical protein n=1 Tax=Lactobacillus acidophilus TaxID=1579 RepID=UPI003BF5410C
MRKKNGKYPFIDNKIMEEMWGQGFTKTKKLKDSDNVAAYLMAYLTDMPKDEILPSKTKSKSIIKGARLHFYPTGVHIYRSSRGIRHPNKIVGSKKEVLNSFGLSQDMIADATYLHKVKLKDDRALKYVTEFYDNVGEKKKANQARQDND